MSEIERKLQRALSGAHRSVDEDFVRMVARRVDAHESVRLISLSLLTFAALCFLGVFCHGLSLIALAARGASVSLAGTLSTTGPLLTIALLAFVSLFLVRMVRSRD